MLHATAQLTAITQLFASIFYNAGVYIPPLQTSWGESSVYPGFVLPSISKEC